MQQAQQQLGRQNPKQGGQQQQQAQKSMQKAKEELDKLAKRPLTEEENKRAEQLAREQQKNKELTNELEKQVEDLDNDQAKRSLNRAGQSMEGAKKQLNKQQPGRAFELEEESLEDLKRAQQEMKKQMEELRRQAEQERMVLIEQELKKIVKVQVEKINARTTALYKIREEKGFLTRGRRIEAKKLGSVQGMLKQTLDQIDKKLGEEAVEIFRWYILSAAEDMEESQESLKMARLGVRTQEVQKDIVRKLKDLIEAFDVKLRASQKQQQGGGGGGGKPPLVPDIVQLNLMKKMQENVLRKTRRFRRQFNEERRDLSPSEKLILKRLSEEEGELSGILKRFIEKFEKQKKEQERDF